MQKVMAEEEPQVKKLKPSVISDFVLSAEFQQLFFENWHNFIDVKTDNLEIISKPFRVCRISNFICNEELMDELKNDLLDVRNRRICMDLYQFEQTDDLANVETENIKLLYETFQTDFAAWLEKNTKIELNKTISMSSTCYSDTDYLLCHDDNLGDRRIAYILYISKEWTESDGGTLDLFDTDENGMPRDIVKSLVPEYNTLVFFEVADNSYHQVAEVINPHKSRWSINGWFHGPVKENNKPPRIEIEPDYIQPINQTIDLNDWVSDYYLFTKIKENIQHDVERDSYTYLSNFLKDEVYEMIATDVMSETIVWKKVGPADMRRYEVAEEETLPESVKNLCKMFKSVAMCQLLKDYTELDLVAVKETMNPKLVLELQRWSQGCYTLICDKPIASDYSDQKSNGSQSIYQYDDMQEDESEILYRSTKEDQGKTNGDNRSLESNYCGTPMSIKDDDDDDDIDDELLRKILKTKSPRTRKKYLAQHAALLKMGNRSPQKPRVLDTDDSDVSDIGDYLSDPLDCSVECSDEEKKTVETNSPVLGALDVILQVHASNAPQEECVIEYLDPTEQDTAIIQIPTKDNHLSIVYKTGDTCRVHKYVNHYYSDYFYNLICTYYE